MSYVQLTSEERYVIYHLKLYCLSLREIGRRLGRSHTTISRELKRNGPIISSWVYWLKARTSKRYSAENSHVTTEGAPMHRWCATLNKDCMQNGRPMSSLQS